MSIKNFSNQLFSISIPDSSTSIHLGSFTNDSTARQLGIIRCIMYLQGQMTGERLTLAVTDDIASPTFSWHSDAVLASQIYSGSSGWLGWVRFDFSKQWLAASTEYQLLISATGNTETDDRSLNLVYDYPAPWNGSRQDQYNEHPIAFQVFGYERG
jgi:hypothetical protein